MLINWDIVPFTEYGHIRSMSQSQSAITSSYRYGSITKRQYDWAMLFCMWSAVRSEGTAGKMQDRCYDAFGSKGVDRRIERIKKLQSIYIQKHFGEYAK